MMSSPVQCLIKISNSIVQTTLINCRNDPTNYSIHVREPNTGARYMAKYITKGELF